MQISRHWRLNSKRYRLEGVRYENGEVRLQERMTDIDQEKATSEVQKVVLETTTKQVVAA